MAKIHHDLPRLWQKPKKTATMQDEFWYDRVAVGVNTLGKFMKELSKDAELLSTFTNHSIRATCITNLDEAGFESRHIMSVSSHKSESTVKAYAKKCPENKKHAMSSALSNKIAPAKKPKPEPVQETVPDVLELMETDPNDDQVLSKFLEATERALAETTGANTAAMPPANQNFPINWVFFIPQLVTVKVFPARNEMPYL